MKTSWSGSRSSYHSNQRSRRFRMSGRSCSVAYAVFFYACSRDGGRTTTSCRSPPRGRHQPATPATRQGRCRVSPRKHPWSARHAPRSCPNVDRHPAAVALACRAERQVAVSESRWLRSHQTAPQPAYATDRSRSPPQPCPKGSMTRLAPSMPASKTSTYPESEYRSGGNPQQFSNRPNSSDTTSKAKPDKVIVEMMAITGQ